MKEKKWNPLMKRFEETDPQNAALSIEAAVEEKCEMRESDRAPTTSDPVRMSAIDLAAYNQAMAIQAFADKFVLPQPVGEYGVRLVNDGDGHFDEMGGSPAYSEEQVRDAIAKAIALWGLQTALDNARLGAR